MVSEAIEGGAGQQVVGKGVGPFLEGAIAGDDERGPLVAFGDDLIEVLGGLRRKGLQALVCAPTAQAKVIENQEIHGQHLGQEALMRAVGAGRMQVRQETVNGSGHARWAARQSRLRASKAKALAKWLLPTPVGPQNRTFS
jgi:hypothetical protein